MTCYVSSGMLNPTHSLTHFISDATAAAVVWLSAFTGYLTLLEILEIYWNNFSLLEVMEIYWKLAKSPGNFLAEFVCLLLYDAKFLYFTVYQ